jgi:hypothetical protein
MPIKLRPQMLDILSLFVTLGLFGSALAYLAGCERL